MNIINLDSSSFIGLSSKYSLDNTVELNQNIFFSEQQITVPLNEALKDVNDNKINNYSNLFLTKNEFLTSAVNIKNLEPLDDEGFSTFFAANAPGVITPTTKFWVVSEPPINENTAALACSGEFAEIDNRYFFDVELISENLCKISHENENILRYLTVDYTDNLSFVKDLQLDSLGEYSPQVFYYIYDRRYSFMVLLKNINDIPFFVTFNPTLQTLTLLPPITGTTVPYSISSIFRIKTRNPIPNKTIVSDPWLSYKRDLKTNSQNVNFERSFNDIKSNILMNSEYYNISGNFIDFNLLSLKNSNTPENYQSRGNPFFNEQNIQFRDYTSLFTGSNQELGNDNITINYETYTTNILLKKDKVTYFHIPQVFYPFERLNVNDSNLINAGAIAGDHPLKADKIFKKKANYKFSSNFGNTIEENSGEFLCAWLSGSSDVNVKPVWVDRYYKPRNISFISALTASDYKAIKYVSIFDCLFDKAKELIGDVDVFDKPSDLIFEKGTYYAYHHYGPKDVDKFIKSFEDKLIQTNLSVYKYFNGSDVAYDSEVLTEYSFNGDAYASTNSLSTIKASNQFTLIFDAYSSNWNSPLGYQLIGNYDRDGFGIFNKNTVTPTLYFYGSSGLTVTNTDLSVLNSVELPANISGCIRLQGLSDAFLILNDNTVRRYNLSYAEISKYNYSRNIKNLYDIDYNENYAFALYNNVPATEVALINLKTNEVIKIDTVTSPYIIPDSNFSSQSRTVNLYNDILYFTNGIKAERYKSKLFYLKDNFILLRDLSTSNLPITAFKASTGISDFSIDFESNIWILYNDTFAKFSIDREFILSGKFTDTVYNDYKIFFTSDFNNSTYNQYVNFVRQSQVQPKKLNILKYRINGEYISNTYFSSNTASNLNISNNEFLRSYVSELYPENSINVKALLTNNFNQADTANAEIIFNLSALDVGYHNFAVRFDAFEGLMFLFVDGQLQGKVQFEPRKYILNNIAERPFLVGSSSYLNSIPIFSYLKNASYLVSNLKIKNFYVYNRPLNNYDIFFHTRKGMDIRDLIFDVACGRRNYTEEIERYFKLRAPGSKSTLFNLNIRNTGISDPNLQKELEKRILSILADTAPAYTKLNTIKWKN